MSHETEKIVVTCSIQQVQSGFAIFQRRCPVSKSFVFSCSNMRQSRIQKSLQVLRMTAPGRKLSLI